MARVRIPRSPNPSRSLSLAARSGHRALRDKYVNQQLTPSGIFTDAALAALFVANIQPTETEVSAAMADAQTYGEVANRLITAVGIKPHLYAAQQPVYGPLVRLLSLAGWTVSGSGYFSIAFFNGGLALKVSLRASNDAARDYLEWCKDNAHLPGVPCLYALGDYGHSYVVLMDRYTPITGELDEDGALYDPSVAAEYAEVKGALETGSFGSFATAKTAAAIRDTFLDVGVMDCHSGNVMLDRHGCMVITDPLGMSVGDYGYSYGSYTETPGSLIN